jgi:type VI secretion system protein ImpK
VVEYLGRETGTPGRFTAEGRAETEPLVPNDTRDNRARNRRVEITLVTAHGRG